MVGFEPTVITNFADSRLRPLDHIVITNRSLGLFTPLVPATTSALRVILKEQPNFVEQMGFEPTLCLRCHIKCASLIEFHFFSVLPQNYSTMFQIAD